MDYWDYCGGWKDVWMDGWMNGKRKEGFREGIRELHKRILALVCNITEAGASTQFNIPIAYAVQSGKNIEESSLKALTVTPQVWTEIGESEMVFDEMRPRIRHRLPGIHLTVGENLGKDPTSDAAEICHVRDALTGWYTSSQTTHPPAHPEFKKQSDVIFSQKILDKLLSSFKSEQDIVRLLALQESESGAWLHALLSPHIGTPIDSIHPLKSQWLYALVVNSASHTNVFAEELLIFTAIMDSAVRGGRVAFPDIHLSMISLKDL
ncbi:hypothetical protein ANN_03536 [Periplaneta americana]|uniref:Uncharacterized protein n=1 Tax=Periplaneta americana TaxID=6978 RepID=A0ABQ8TZ82_PERAM|nr:hypothetical protein ANN_03536 [Periplaneta americana]